LEKVTQDYDSLRVFDCPAYYHVKEDKLGLKARKGVFVWSKKGVKCYKFWDPEDKKFIFSRDVTFDKASMMKPTYSQQVESEKTCNAPIPRIRRRYGDVYTQSRNILMYIR